MLLTLQDRVRLPWLGGARRVKLLTVLPIVMIPGILLTAAWHPVLTLALVFLVPLFLAFMRRQLWLHDPEYVVLADNNNK